jgi:Mn2+/Fe2+ NRAMP family transporter
MKIKNILSMLGPGLLYAGAAIGVSHLVQSTRAGADYYFDLLWILLLANALKYPFFEFGPRYASATGKSLIDGYSEVGRWAVVLFTILTLTTMFAVQAAVTVVTAGIAGQVFHINISTPVMSAIILGSTMLLLIVGRYKILDRLIKVVILVLALSTIVAVISAFIKKPVGSIGTMSHFNWQDSVDIFFLIAFIGWMPAPIDVSVWQSLWTLAKKKSTRKRIGWKDSRLDFNIGYIGTAMMAIGFLTLGAKIMFGPGQSMSSDGVTFAQQLISMYTTTIGNWSYFIIAIAALTTMYSTTLTVVDAFPRVLEALTARGLGSASRNIPENQKVYWFWLIILVAGSLIMLTYLSSSMRVMVDLATTLSFITAPVLAYLNFRVVTHGHMPRSSMPEKWLRIWAWIGITFLTGFTIFYLVYRIISMI